MGQVKIVTGKTGSGKGKWADAWVAEAPAQRRKVTNLAAGIAALKSGLDVVMDLEELAKHDVTVVTFGA
jgi:adenosyl cobinamide kinase/adenosyl cobinamide phosphate guanylyltransferase